MTPPKDSPAPTSPKEEGECSTSSSSSDSSTSSSEESTAAPAAAQPPAPPPAVVVNPVMVEAGRLKEMMFGTHELSERYCTRHTTFLEAWHTFTARVWVNATNNWEPLIEALRRRCRAKLELWEEYCQVCVAVETSNVIKHYPPAWGFMNAIIVRLGQIR